MNTSPFRQEVLNRQEEAEMRLKLTEADLIECVLGLGPNLFYNSLGSLLSPLEPPAKFRHKYS